MSSGGFLGALTPGFSGRWQLMDVFDGRTPILPMVASGGNVFDYAVGFFVYRSHRFNSTGSFVVTNLGSRGEVEYLIIGGGGGGGSVSLGQGGGAGGYRTNVPGNISGGNSVAEARLVLTSTGTYSVAVGGGSGPVGTGASSSVFSITSFGGGVAANRGSATANFGAGTAGQGSAGGVGGAFNNGGGGGAGQNGANAAGNLSDGFAGKGGDGLRSSIDGTFTARAGGGGGGGGVNVTRGAGGLGGGAMGRGRGTCTDCNADAGAANTGGGGGGTTGWFSSGHIGGNGGSGVVIIRYRIA